VNVANLISLLRLAAVPLVVWLIATERFAVAFWLFVAAGVSAAIGGYLARVLNQRPRFLREHRVAIAPKFISKANTTAQIAFAALVLARYGLDFRGIGWNAAIEWAGYVVALTTLFSGAHYVVVGVRQLAAADGTHAGP
jgi:phosphatidylglycerophosphate synthase